MKGELHGSAEFRRLNPHLFGMGGLPAAVRKQDKAAALDQEPSRTQASVSGLAYRVAIIRSGQRILDGDNLQGAYKSLRDAIAWTLGADDSDEIIAWEYGQIKSEKQGTIVRIERL